MRAYLGLAQRSTLPLATLDSELRAQNQVLGKTKETAETEDVAVCTACPSW